MNEGPIFCKCALPHTDAEIEDARRFVNAQRPTTGLTRSDIEGMRLATPREIAAMYGDGMHAI
jgi:hypothetical protein